LKKVKVYLKPFCPYCRRVKSYLQENSIDFEEIDVSNDRKLYTELKAKTGHSTVPQIFINNEFIGGSDDFFKLLEAGKIDL